MKATCGIEAIGRRGGDMNLRNALLVILGLVLAFVVYDAVFDKPEGALRTVPDRFHGAWVTAHSGYSDRYLEFRRETVTFGTGGVNSQTFKITGFDHSREPDGRELNTVYFRSVNGSDFSRQFHFSEGKRKTLVFVDQPDVDWTQ
jgi:hypothetical protein